MSPQAALQITCAAGRFGSPGWFIFARSWNSAATSEFVLGEGREHVGIVSDRGSGAIVPVSDDELPHHVWEDDPRSFSVADLDGDGVDEILDEQDWTTHGGSHKTLHVLRVQGHALVEAGATPEYDTDDTAEANDVSLVCSGSWKLEHSGSGARVIVTVTTVSDPERCALHKDRHTFALDHDVFAETTPGSR